MLLVYFILAFFSLEYLLHVFLTPIVCSYYNIDEKKELKSIAYRLVCIITYIIQVYLAMSYRGNVDEDHVFGKSGMSSTFAIFCIAHFIHDSITNIIYMGNNVNLHQILVFIHHVFGSIVLYFIFLHEDAICEYYGLYYFGMSEFSNIPLCIMNFYTDYKLKKRKEYFIIQALFFVLFILFRTVGFVYLFFLIQIETYEHLDKILPGPYITMITAEYFFTGLMIYWSYKIVIKAVKKLIQ